MHTRQSLVGRSGNSNHMKAEGVAGKWKEGYQNSGGQRGAPRHPRTITSHCIPWDQSGGMEGMCQARQGGFSHPRMLRDVGRSPGCPSTLSIDHFLQPSTQSLDNSCSQTHRILLKFPKRDINNIINSYFALRYQIFKSGSQQS